MLSVPCPVSFVSDFELRISNFLPTVGLHRMLPDRLQHQLDVYKGLVEVSALINGITESAELMPAILDVARRVMHVEAASLFLVDADGNLDLAIASNSTGQSGPPPM